jgi:hypothetical protein
MDVTQRCQWRWLHQGIGLAMRMASPRGARAWYVINPLRTSGEPARAMQRDQRMARASIYHVRRLEGQYMNLLQILQMEEGDVQCVEEFFACGDDHLSDRLEQRGLSIATFYPLSTAAPARDGQGVVSGLRPASL